MPSVYDGDNFQGRVDYAASVISRKGGATRHFDTCFEMDDGEAVAAALWKRSLKNPRLASNLPKYINADMARGDYEKLLGKDLTKAAARMRAEAETRRNGKGE